MAEGASTPQEAGVATCNAAATNRAVQETAASVFLQTGTFVSVARKRATMSMTALQITIRTMIQIGNKECPSPPNINSNS